MLLPVALESIASARILRVWSACRKLTHHLDLLIKDQDSGFLNKKRPDHEEWTGRFN